MEQQGQKVKAQRSTKMAAEKARNGMREEKWLRRALRYPAECVEQPIQMEAVSTHRMATAGRHHP